MFDRSANYLCKSLLKVDLPGQLTWWLVNLNWLWIMRLCFISYTLYLCPIDIAFFCFWLVWNGRNLQFWFYKFDWWNNLTWCTEYMYLTWDYMYTCSFDINLTMWLEFFQCISHVIFDLVHWTWCFLVFGLAHLTWSIWLWITFHVH